MMTHTSTEEFFFTVIKGMQRAKRWKCFVGMVEEEEGKREGEKKRVMKMKPVCACTSFLDSNSVLGIYKVTTLREYRKNGYGLKLMRECLKVSKEEDDSLEFV